MKILFLVKQAYSYELPKPGEAKSGLLNSADITSSELNRVYGVRTKVDICQDENSIDRSVTLFSPHLCVIEAVWVTPKKMAELKRLHPDVRFVIRIHSEVPFIATEGNLIDWIHQYFALDIIVAFNSKDTTGDFTRATTGNIVYLPNIYTHVAALYHNRVYRNTKDTGIKKIAGVVKNEINIGCFGAVRPMKDQLIQAFAAIEMAKKHFRKLRFHINAGRAEQGGGSVLKNLRSLFANSPFELVEHSWMDRKMFLKVISKMDAGMQVSFSESFNLVTADFVYSNVPIVASDAVKWMPNELQASTINASDIVQKLWNALVYSDYYKQISKCNLAYYNASALEAWGDALHWLR